jgi:hypothetical protein
MKASVMSANSKRGRIAAIAVAVVFFMLQGCANYQTRIADGKALHPQYEGGMMNAYAWGAWVSPEIMSAEQCKQGMYDVVVENNFFYSLAGVVTLGLWMPMDVSFRCKAPGAVDGGVVPP